SPQSATSAGTRGFGDGPFLPFEALALVLGARHVNDASSLVARPWTRSVPDDIDVAFRISRDRPSAVQPIELVKIPFGFKGRSCIIQSGIKQWRHRLAINGDGRCAFAAVPSHVHAPV